MESIKVIYLAGGCFWGVEAYFSKIPGIVNTTVGYANGNFEGPTYEQVSAGNTGFAETVLVEYDLGIISLKEILQHYFEIVDPTTLNKQGNDVGEQYRSGIYYADENDKAIIEHFIEKEAKKYDKPIMVEVKRIENFFEAEEYHQKYLDKNPGGYCHIDLSKVEKYTKYKKPTLTELKAHLTDIEYKVTQENETELPFSSELEKNFEEGIYVDVVTGEPLFSSKDKFECECGWPSFTNPITNTAVKEKPDYSHHITRMEVRSSIGNSHLGHVFEDGPVEKTGLRYCINGAALRFISRKDLEKEGYEELQYLFKP